MKVSHDVGFGMNSLLVEGAFLRMKQPLFVSGLRIFTDVVLKLNRIHEVCEERVYYIQLDFLYLDGTGRNFSWTRSQPIEEETGREFFEAVTVPFEQASNVPTEEPSGEPYEPSGD